jgi:bifunctional non-homologous end joining protein LigD
MLATLAPKLPIGKDWSYEVKWDGYRTLAAKDGPRVTLYSRNLKNATVEYPSIARAVASIALRAAILDGELVAIDAEGHPSFQALHHQAIHHLAYYVFDILHNDGRDLTRHSLSERRAILPGSAVQIEHAVRELGLEGVVAKRLDSSYYAGRRSGSWIKVKFQQRQELVIGGFTDDDGRVDALVVGYYEGRRLMCAGKVRAGLTPLLRRQLRTKMMPLGSKTCPFANLPDVRTGHWGEGITAEEMGTIVWVRPVLVAEIAFTEWTRDRHLRHAAFVGLREDIRPQDVRRERERAT